MRICIRNTAYFLRNLRICDLRDWDIKKICGFAICGLIITNLRIYDCEMSPRICRFVVSGQVRLTLGGQGQDKVNTGGGGGGGKKNKI